MRRRFATARCCSERAGLAALPVGGFSCSEGLEAVVEAGLVRDEAQAGGWLLELPQAQRQAHALGLAILSSRHESQYSRLFRS